MTTSSVMVVMNDRTWTLEALHLACALARTTGTAVTLVTMIPVTHAPYLGTDIEGWHFSAQNRDDIAYYQQLASDYGVALRTRRCQYVTLVDAICQMAEEVGAQTVFATLAASVVPFWRAFQLWLMRAQLQRGKRTLYTLDAEPNAASTKPRIIITTR